MSTGDVVVAFIAGASVVVAVAAFVVALLARRDSKRSAKASERSADAAEAATEVSQKQLAQQLTPKPRLQYVGPHGHDEIDIFELHHDGPVDLDSIEVRPSARDVNLVGVRGLTQVWDAGEDLAGEDMAPVRLTRSMISEGGVPVGSVTTFGAVLEPGHGDVRFMVIAVRGGDQWTVPVATHLDRRPGPRTRPYLPPPY